MVEYGRYLPEDQQVTPIHLIEVSPRQADVFFLNDRLEILVACNAVDSAGQLQVIYGSEHVLDLSLCFQDSSTETLVKTRDLDPATPNEFKGNDIIRLRYQVDGIIEEARFTHKNSTEKKLRMDWTTPRMRRVMQYELGRQ